MTTTHQFDNSERSSLLEQIAAITTMQEGSLAEEWRERPSADGQSTIRLGPYYKHQVWKDGRNRTRRVPAQEAAQLRQDIDNAKRFEQLTDQLAHLNIQHTLALRADQARDSEIQESKKNSKPRQVTRDLPKQRRSSPKPKRP